MPEKFVFLQYSLRKTFLLVFGLILFGLLTMPFAFAQTNPRQVIPLDEGWRFRKGDDAAAKEANFDDKGWPMLNLPHDWTIESPVNPPPNGERNGGYFSHGIGWYRKDFTFSDTTKQLVVEFDGVYMNSDVWINGQFLGRRPYGFNGFRYDITEYLKRDGSPNVLAVRVDDSAEPSVRWYAGSGIYRHVRLIATGYTHFQLDGGVYVTTPEVTADKATIKASYFINPNFFTDAEFAAWSKSPWQVKPQSKTITLRSVVLTPDGTVITSTESQVTLKSMHKGDSAVQQFTVVKPRLWSDKTPELYRLRSTLLLDGKILDETVTTFGIRSLKYEADRGLFINGKSTKLKGVCIHQDAGSFGNAVPIAIWEYRLGLLKQMGCNAIRPSHHPFAPEFYDLCDKMGFYVFDEAFDEWTRDWTFNYTENTRGKAKYGYHLYFNQWHEADLREMLRRDRNHPSVILYSIGNEIPDQFDDEGWKLAKKLVDICHEEDPTRPATSACDQSYVSSRNGFMDQLDIAGYNYIDRLYKDSTYVPEHRRFPHRLFLGTETTHAVHYWLGVRDNDYVIGDFIWTGIDYLGEAGPYPRRGSRSGIIDLAGGKKPGFHQRAAYWREDPVLQIFVSAGNRPQGGGQGQQQAMMKWNWPDSSKLSVRAATNCDEVELFLNKRSLGRKPVNGNTYFNDWAAVYQPGQLEAVGYIKGKKAAASKLVTAGAATNLKLIQMPLVLNKDVALFEVSICDKTGMTVADAKDAITINVEGGQLIGIDTGELEYTGDYKTNTRNAYQGRILVSVKKTSAAGEIRITGTALGLTKGVLLVK